MTIRAELDLRGIELYGTRSIVLHPEPKDYLLFDEYYEYIDPALSMGAVVVPSGFDISSSQDLHSDRRFVTIKGKDQVEISLYSYADGKPTAMKLDGVGMNRDGVIVYNGSQINEMNVLDASINLPGMYPGQPISARIRWEKDLPIISKIKRGWAEYIRASRIENVLIDNSKSSR